MPPRRKETLDQFIQHSTARGLGFPNNAWVTCSGFKALYVRFTKRSVNFELLSPVLDIANVTARNPGAGEFTKLVKRLRADYPHMHICVEQAHERFGAYLLRQGFTKLDPRIAGESYFLRAEV